MHHRLALLGDVKMAHAQLFESTVVVEAAFASLFEADMHIALQRSMRCYFCLEQLVRMRLVVRPALGNATAINASRSPCADLGWSGEGCVRALAPTLPDA